MSDLAERITALSPEQRALFEALLKKKGLRAPEAQTIPRVERVASNLYPPSIDQERLWFIEQLQPGNTAYNIFTASRLRGPFDAGAMSRAANELLRRHEVLRTTFRVVEGQPMQYIAPTLELSLVPVDLETLAPEGREAEALRLVLADVSAPFDLERGPLVRAGLLRLGATDHVFYLNMHHSITDRWSADIIEQDIGALYYSFLKAEPPALPELPIQFVDYAVWQRERMGGEVYRQQLAYWRKRLEGAPLVLELPADRPRPTIQTFRGARVYFRLRKELLDALRELSREEGATMYMTLMSAYKLLLSRYTGQEDIVVGCSIANRDRPETQHMVGFLLNLLVLRTDLSGNPTFRELLARERETALGAYANQDLPFGKLVQELRPTQDPSRNPIAQAAFIYLDFPELKTMEAMGLEVTPLVLDNGASRFDLTLALTETDHGFDGSFEYLADLYDRARFERMARHLETLLEHIVADPDRRIRELPLVTPEERRHLLHDLNDTRRDSAHPPTIHQLFEEQVERTPEAPALEFDGEVLSYRELNGRADRLARRLRALGVRPEVRVGLVMERSAEQIIGLLGVLKAGGAYVPVEASAPRERIRYVLADAGVRVVVTRGELAGGLVAEDVEVLDIKSVGGETTEGGPVESGAVGENAAYVIYTSGSTGRPKGVVVSHASLVNSMLAPLSPTPEPITASLMLMSYAFDASLLNVFRALGHGAKLTVPREGEQADPARVARLIEESGISTIFTVPSFYGLLLEQAPPEQLRPLRAVHVGGEVCTPELVGTHRRLLPDTRLFNVYGPTEATVWCISHETRAGDADRPAPIGRPSHNVQIYVLDEHLQPAPVGVPGELFIGGRGVARGYLNRPALTAERFVPHPYGDAGERLYRTGDRARVSETGEIEYLGRFDQQVKVRGYRIELGEIEAALSRLDGVKEAAVVVREDEGGGRRLVAYLVAEAGARAGAERLRDALRESLPEYMMPSAFVLMEELPRTPSGKVDRTALPAPDAAQSASEAPYEPPRTVTEEMLSKLWGGVLGRERVGVHNNFFELGGDSLLATKLAYQVRTVFEIELPLTTLFRHPTVADLALFVEEELAAQMDDISEEEAERLLEDGQAPGL
ncbi:MAG TPA: amino acid adenylation domain-containing protein [Pyrinomonadaceae bacterium]|jgi:amino acid adenylation domain-containing protein|nr:amino acid adenylation domain-containing protein [Pyrinomonadaceae bacterium]